jgi:hypothetical protein
VKRPRLATPGIIGNDKGILIDHCRLDARPRTHIDAYLFAHKACQHIGRRGEQADRRIGDRRGISTDKVAGKRRRIGEIEDPGSTRRHADQHPDDVLHEPFAQLVRGPGRRIELYACVAVALRPALNHEEEVGPHGLRACIAAPGPSYDGGNEKQSDPRHDEKSGHIVEFLRPYLDKEEVEAAMCKIDQDGLVRRIRTTIPSQPRCDIINAKGHGHDQPFEPAEVAGSTPGVDLRARSIELHALRRVDGLDIVTLDIDRLVVEGLLRQGK